MTYARAALGQSLGSGLQNFGRQLMELSYERQAAEERAERESREERQQKFVNDLAMAREQRSIETEAAAAMERASNQRFRMETEVANRTQEGWQGGKVWDDPETGMPQIERGTFDVNKSPEVEAARLRGFQDTREEGNNQKWWVQQQEVLQGNRERLEGIRSANIAGRAGSSSGASTSTSASERAEATRLANYADDAMEDIRLRMEESDYRRAPTEAARQNMRNGAARRSGIFADEEDVRKALLEAIGRSGGSSAPSPSPPPAEPAGSQPPPLAGEPPEFQPLTLAEWDEAYLEGRRLGVPDDVLKDPNHPRGLPPRPER